MRIAVFLPNWLGDAVMATPALRAIRERFAADHLAAVVRPHLVELFNGTRWFDAFHPADFREGRPLAGRWDLIRRLRRERFDRIVLLTNSFGSALLAFLSGVRERIGYRRAGRGWLLTEMPAAPHRGAAVPMVDYYLHVAACLGATNLSPRLELGATVAEERQAAGVFAALGLNRDDRVVALNCSGAFGAAKLWPRAHFAALARQIVERLDHDVLVLCGPSERHLAREIAERAASPRVVSLADQPVGLGLTKGCLRRTRLLVTTDSGPRHVAAAYGVPVVTLFGPTDPMWVANPTVRGIDVRLPARALDCLGCGRRTCPRGDHACMQRLKPAAVFPAVADLLGQPSALRRQPQAA